MRRTNKIAEPFSLQAYQILDSWLVCWIHRHIVSLDSTKFSDYNASTTAKIVLVQINHVLWTMCKKTITCFRVWGPQVLTPGMNLREADICHVDEMGVIKFVACPISAGDDEFDCVYLSTI